MRFDRPRTLRLGRLLTLAFWALATSGAALGASPEPSPETVVRNFLGAFEKKDVDTAVTFFAPDARIQAARLSGEEVELDTLGVEAWAEESRAGLVGARELRIEILEVSSFEFPGGANVAVRFRASGKAGTDFVFANDGVDTFSLVPRGGQWRIVLYNTMERMEFHRESPPGD